MHRHNSLILEQELLRLCIAVCVKREPTGQVQVRVCYDFLEKSVYIDVNSWHPDSFHLLMTSTKRVQVQTRHKAFFKFQDLSMMSAAHYVAPEHTLLHQASILSFCYKCVHVYTFTISIAAKHLSWRSALSIALQGLRCQQLAVCARQERTGLGQARRYCLRFALHITSAGANHVNIS